jgi:hypothetical protein
MRQSGSSIAGMAHALAGEVEMGGDPVVDGAGGDVEEVGQFVVGRAEQAVIVCQLAVVGGVAGGTAMVPMVSL